MSILYPSLLWLLIPLAVLFYYRPKILPDTVNIVILMLLVVTLSRPVWEETPQTKEIEAKDIIIAIDVSYSMMADDMTPNRYEYAKTLIEALLQNNVSDNITLIAFTTNPLLLSPPTTDHQLISLALKSLQIENILTHGTSLKKLFDKVASLPIQEKSLILISDGGDENDLDLLSSILSEHAIYPLILATGTTNGATIPKNDGTLLKDDEGNLVVSRVNPMLQPLAEQNGGVFIMASGSASSDAQKLQNALDDLSIQKNLIEKTTRNYTELYPLPLLAALILFLLLHTRGVKYLLMFAALAGTQANASWLDNYTLKQAYESYGNKDYNYTVQTLQHLSSPSLQSRYAQASSAYRLGDYNKALKLYGSIRSTSPQIKQTLYYNIANCYTMLFKYDKAKEFYSKALQLGNDEDAHYNLALIALLENRKDIMGMSQPKSQESSSSKSENQESEESENERAEEQSSSGSGDGGTEKQQKSKEEIKLIEDYQSKEQPLGSKAYEMINKGYIHEKQPW